MFAFGMLSLDDVARVISFPFLKFCFHDILLIVILGIYFFVSIQNCDSFAAAFRMERFKIIDFEYLI